jgi:hypothetical protein
MSAGTNFARQEYCRRTSKGLWIRGRYSALEGTIVLEYQTRVISTGIGQLVVLDAEGDVVGSAFPDPLRGSMPAEWNEVGVVSVDTAPFYAFIKKVQSLGLKAADACGAVCRIAVTLAEQGYEMGEIMPWLAAPLDGEWVVDGTYEVLPDARGVLEGFDRYRIEVKEDDRARTRECATDCTLLYDGREIEVSIDNAELATFTRLV